MRSVAGVNKSPSVTFANPYAVATGGGGAGRPMDCNPRCDPEDGVP